MLKGRQTGTMHRGHSWVFRAESYDTMMAWYEDIENLMGRSGETRNAFVRRHFRSTSGASVLSTNTNDMEEDEADRTPYSADTAVLGHEARGGAVEERPQPGGRFPSDVQIDTLRDPVSPSSGASSVDREFPATCTETGSQHEARHLGVDVEHPRTSLSARSQSSYSNSEREQNGGDTTIPTRPKVAAQASSESAARRESASTVPTTNNTEHTYNTQATSVDEDDKPSVSDKTTQVEDSKKEKERKKSAVDISIPGQYVS